MAPSTSIINNLNYFAQRVATLGEDEFFPIMVFKLKADNPEMEMACQVLLRENISSVGQFEELRDHIVAMCVEENAKCFMNVCRRDWNTVLVEMAKLVEVTRKTRDFEEASNVYNRALTTASCEESFIVNVKGHGSQLLETVKHKLRVTSKNPTLEVATLATPDGYQLVCEAPLTKEVAAGLATIPQVRTETDGLAMAFGMRQQAARREASSTGSASSSSSRGSEDTSIKALSTAKYTNVTRLGRA